MTDTTVSRLLDIVETQAKGGALAFARPLMSATLDLNVKSWSTTLLSGKKTYILSALGVTSSLALGGIDIIQHGLSTDNAAAIIAGLIGSGFPATIRSAIANHCGQAGAVAYDIGEQVVLQLIQQHQQQAPVIASQIIAALPDEDNGASDEDKALAAKVAFEAAAARYGYVKAPVAQPALDAVAEAVAQPAPEVVLDPPAPADAAPAPAVEPPAPPAQAEPATPATGGLLGSLLSHARYPGASGKA